MKFKKALLVLAVAGACFCAHADTAAPTVLPQQSTQTPKKGNQWSGMLMPIILIVLMIFIFSRTNKKQQKKRQEMLDSIVKGSKVLLNSGVYGKIVEVRENEFLVEIAENVRVLVVKGGVASVEDEEKKEAAK